ncbi:DUF7477 domain-containing protein [Fibrella arboris]|uniref:DUF7477 domain-containing protein n=1 Tax=Fibrella arboris TaxID=3242486 RepID=UPI0035201ECD
MKLIFLLSFLILPAFDSLAQTCISGDCQNGLGKMQWGDAIYEGEFKNGRISGFGVRTRDGLPVVGYFNEWMEQDYHRQLTMDQLKSNQDLVYAQFKKCDCLVRKEFSLPTIEWESVKYDVINFINGYGVKVGETLRTKTNINSIPVEGYINNTDHNVYIRAYRKHYFSGRQVYEYIDDSYVVKPGKEVMGNYRRKPGSSSLRDYFAENYVFLGQYCDKGAGAYCKSISTTPAPLVAASPVKATSVNKQSTDQFDNNYLILSNTKPDFKASWDDALACRAICFADNTYYSFLIDLEGDGQGYVAQSGFPEAYIKESWKATPGTIISSIDYLNGQWHLVMTNYGDDAISQTYLKQSYFPEDKIKEKWSTGYRITYAAASPDGEWVVVMTKPKNYAPITEQTYSWYTEFPSTAIKKYWEKNYYITLLKYLNGKWLLVMSQYSDRNGNTFKQSYATGSQFPMEKFTAYDKEGFTTLSASYGNGLWAIVINKSLK